MGTNSQNMKSKDFDRCDHKPFILDMGHGTAHKVTADDFTGFLVLDIYSIFQGKYAGIYSFFLNNKDGVHETQ